MLPGVSVFQNRILIVGNGPIQRVSLVDVGLLVKSGRTYVPADNVAALADRLALELGGVEACAHRENQYRDEARQWQETQLQWEKEQESWNAPAHDNPRDPFEPRKNLVQDPFGAGNPAHCREEESLAGDEGYQPWYEEQLLLHQLGLPNELEP